MKNQTIVLLTAIAVIVLAALFLKSPTSLAQDKAEQPKVASEFEGKYVTVYLSGTRRGSGEVFTDAKLIKVGGRTMIVGTGADTGEADDWRIGLQIGVPWDSVSRYYVMTEEQFEKKILEQVH